MVKELEEDFIIIETSDKRISEACIYVEYARLRCSYCFSRGIFVSVDVLLAWRKFRMSVPNFRS